MNGKPTGFHALIGTLGDPAPARTATRLLMLDSSGGAATLVFDSADGRHTGTVGRWLAIVRWGGRADGSPASQVIWLLDGSTATWAAGRPPAGLRQGTTGLGPEASLVLWFHARTGRRGRRPVRWPRVPPARNATARKLLGLPLSVLRWLGGELAAMSRLARGPWGFTVGGVFGAAGIVDGAHVRVSRRLLGRRTRLRMTIDSRVWGLSPGWPDVDGDPAHSRLAITADGVARPLDLAVIRQWL